MSVKVVRWLEIDPYDDPVGGPGSGLYRLPD